MSNLYRTANGELIVAPHNVAAVRNAALEEWRRNSRPLPTGDEGVEDALRTLGFESRQSEDGGLLLSFEYTRRDPIESAKIVAPFTEDSYTDVFNEDRSYQKRIRVEKNVVSSEYVELPVEFDLNEEGNEWNS